MPLLPSWLHEPGLQQWFAATRDTGGEARVVGGAVRDFLRGVTSGDVDIASTLTPAQNLALAAQLGFKAIPTGIAHGTVTVVLPSRVVEVTTLRRDVETDGRHAVVEFTDCFEEDAARRDFTMNALSMDGQGTIHDYFGGKTDIANRTVRFIGDATTRIEEDGLRMLRYFRFLAVMGAAPTQDALDAIRQRREMVATLSGERIATEMQKLLSAETPLEALRAMDACGMPALVSDAAWNTDMLQQLLQLELQQNSPSPSWVRLLAMVHPDVRAACTAWVAQRYKLSRVARTTLMQLSQPLTSVSFLRLQGGGKVGVSEPDSSFEGEGLRASVKEALRKEPRDVVQGRLLLAALDGASHAELTGLIGLARTWEIPIFPVTAHDLLSRGFSEGTALGVRLRLLERKWVESDYRLTRDALLSLPD